MLGKCRVCELVAVKETLLVDWRRCELLLETALLETAVVMLASRIDWVDENGELIREELRDCAV